MSNRAVWLPRELAWICGLLSLSLSGGCGTDRDGGRAAEIPREVVPDAPLSEPIPERTMIMDDGSPSASRPPPPTVAPVEHDGVRYVQDLDHPPQPRDQGFGYLLAVDIPSGELLWQVKVYHVDMVPGLETDVQEVYFASMELMPGGDELLIENEIGGRYLVDLAQRSVRTAP